MGLSIEGEYRMGMTITEKILAAHAGKASVTPGELVECNVDFVMGNDVTAPIAIKRLRENGIREVFDKERIALVPSHFVPAKDINSAQQVQEVKDFANEYGVKYFFEVGQGGIEHALLPENGLVLPGDIVIGADSHTCTYGAIGAFSTGVGSTDLAYCMATGMTWLKVPETMKFVFKGKLPKWVSSKDIILQVIGDIGVDGALYRAMEFEGDTISDLSVEARMTISNMAIEAGGKSGIIAPDAKTEEYVKSRAKRPYMFYQSDPDAKYCFVKEYDATKLEPVVAWPFLPDNIHKVSDSTHVKVDQVIIGSCTNGRIEDLRIAANILKGRKVDKSLKVIVYPATQAIWTMALKEGLIEIFNDAGCIISPATCGPCLGGHMGILSSKETAITTTNRNFVGRIGHPESKAYLASPAVAAASALTGRITHPAEVMD
jgi:3-isopropylmalate/(R)-2-methylmalate dehydratase large subunit